MRKKFIFVLNAKNGDKQNSDSVNNFSSPKTVLKTLF